MDEQTALLTKSEANACLTGNVAIQEDGSLGSVMPDFSGEQQVEEFVEIKVKEFGKKYSKMGGS